MQIHSQSIGVINKFKILFSEMSSSYAIVHLDIVANLRPPGVRTATPSNGDRLAHRHGQFCRSPSSRSLESNYGQGFLPAPFRPRSARTE